MSDRRFRLVRFVAMILVICLALFSPLFRLPNEQAGRVDMNLPTPAPPVATIDRPRPEIHIERVLKLDEFQGFDPDLARQLSKSASMEDLS